LFSFLIFYRFVLQNGIGLAISFPQRVTTFAGELNHEQIQTVGDRYVRVVDDRPDGLWKYTGETG